MSKEREKGMSLIVKSVTRLTVGLVLLYGIYIVLHGHVSPGGGFAGGVILALAFINLVLAFGKETALRKVPESVQASLECTGALLFLAVALLGFAGGYFFFNILPKGHLFDLLSAGIIPVCNIAIGLKVSAGLFSVFLVVVLLDVGREKT